MLKKKWIMMNYLFLMLNAAYLQVKLLNGRKTVLQMNGNILSKANLLQAVILLWQTNLVQQANWLSSQYILFKKGKR